MLKGLPLAYNKDMQEDKEAIFDVITTIKNSLSIFNSLMQTITVNKENMLNASKKGFINATDLADYLVKKGMPFRDAYKISGSIVSYCIEKNITLDELNLEKYKEYSNLFEEDLYKEISLENCTFKRNSIGASSIDSVELQIENLKKW